MQLCQSRRLQRFAMPDSTCCACLARCQPQLKWQRCSSAKHRSAVQLVTQLLADGPVELKADYLLDKPSTFKRRSAAYSG